MHVRSLVQFYVANITTQIGPDFLGIQYSCHFTYQIYTILQYFTVSQDFLYKSDRVRHIQYDSHLQYTLTWLYYI